MKHSHEKYEKAILNAVKPGDIVTKYDIDNLTSKIPLGTITKILNILCKKGKAKIIKRQQVSSRYYNYQILEYYKILKVEQ